MYRQVEFFVIIIEKLTAAQSKKYQDKNYTILKNRQPSSTRCFSVTSATCLQQPQYETRSEANEHNVTFELYAAWRQNHTSLISGEVETVGRINMWTPQAQQTTIPSLSGSVHSSCRRYLSHQPQLESNEWGTKGKYRATRVLWCSEENDVNQKQQLCGQCRVIVAAARSHVTFSLLFKWHHKTQCDEYKARAQVFKTKAYLESVWQCYTIWDRFQQWPFFT